MVVLFAVFATAGESSRTGARTVVVYPVYQRHIYSETERRAETGDDYRSIKEKRWRRADRLNSRW